MIAGAAAAQIVKEQMEDTSRFERESNGRPRRPGGLRRTTASALRAVAERLEPARTDVGSLSCHMRS